MKKGAYIAAWILSVISIAGYFVAPSIEGDALYSIVANFGNYALAATVAIFAYLAYKNTEKHISEERQIAGLLCIAFIFRFFGEVIWTILEIIQAELPYISPADIMWYTSYILVIIVLSKKIKNMFLVNKEKIVSIAILISLILCGILFAHDFANISSLSATDFLDRLILDAYVFFDILIVALLTIILYPLLLDYNKYFRSYIQICTGFVLFAIYDFAYARLVLSDMYGSWQLIDLIYMVSYIFCMFGTYHLYKSVEKEDK